MINNLDEAAIEAERRRVSDDLKKLLPEEWIHEVGSTAIEGLIGKQDLDFLSSSTGAGSLAKANLGVP